MWPDMHDLTQDANPAVGCGRFHPSPRGKGHVVDRGEARCCLGIAWHRAAWRLHDHRMASRGVFPLVIVMHVTAPAWSLLGIVRAPCRIAWHCTAWHRVHRVASACSLHCIALHCHGNAKAVALRRRCAYCVLRACNRMGAQSPPQPWVCIAFALAVSRHQWQSVQWHGAASEKRGYNL